MRANQEDTQTIQELREVLEKQRNFFLGRYSWLTPASVRWIFQALFWLAERTGIAPSIVLFEWIGLFSISGALVGLIATYGTPGWVIAICIAAAFFSTAIIAGSAALAFEAQRPRRRLLTIVFAYFGAIISFSGLYLVCIAFGDYQDATYKYNYYATVSRNAKTVHPLQDERAIAGVSGRLFSSPDWPANNENRFPEGLPAGAYAVDADSAVVLARGASFARAVRFVRGAVIPIIAQCFHLSIVTISTTGYGDIAPRSWYAQLIADLEVLEGLTLAVLAVGSMFAQGTSSSASETKPPLGGGPAV